MSDEIKLFSTHQGDAADYLYYEKASFGSSSKAEKGDFVKPEHIKEGYEIKWVNELAVIFIRQLLKENNNENLSDIAKKFGYGIQKNPNSSNSDYVIFPKGVNGYELFGYTPDKSHSYFRFDSHYEESKTQGEGRVEVFSLASHQSFLIGDNQKNLSDFFKIPAVQKFLYHEIYENKNINAFKQFTNFLNVWGGLSPDVDKEELQEAVKPLGVTAQQALMLNAITDFTIAVNDYSGKLLEARDSKQLKDGAQNEAVVFSITEGQQIVINGQAAQNRSLFMKTLEAASLKIAPVGHAVAGLTQLFMAPYRQLAGALSDWIQKQLPKDISPANENGFIIYDEVQKQIFFEQKQLQNPELLLLKNMIAENLQEQKMGVKNDDLDIQPRAEKGHFVLNLKVATQVG